MNTNDYAVLLTPDDNGTFLATCPDVPEMTTFGDNADDALLRAADALEEAFAARMSRREPLPLPTAQPNLPTVPLTAQTMLKLALYRAMRENQMSKAELARRLNAHAPQVDRLLDLRHKSRVDSLESALHLLGRRVVVNTAAL